MEITLDDIQKWQPESEIENSTDEYYLMLAQYVDKMWKSMGVFPEIDEDIRKGVIVALVSYYQDVVADFGIWRSFVQFCRKEYQKPLPFYDEPENYVDSELNLEDLQFVIWYSLESQLGFQGLVSPFDSDLLRLARQVFKLFDFLYADAPAPEKFREFSEVDLDDREQVADIFRLSGWLFWNSYFLRPTSKFTYEPEVSEDDELSIAETLTDEKRLRTTFEKPTGPLALYVEEWMRLMIDNRLPKEKAKTAGRNHKYFDALTRATGGKNIAFCDSYEALEKFLSEKMEWGVSEGGHLPQMKDFSDFVLFADPEKGLIVAHDIAAFIQHPDNPLYNGEIARREAHRLVMEQGVCPIDLLKYLFAHGMLPDAAYPTGAKGGALMQSDWDFFARLYLQDYYRAD